MKIEKIVCSGANETTDIQSLFALSAEFPQLELGIQVSGKKCGYGSPRFSWLMMLHQEMMHRQKVLPLALHLNQDWVQMFTAGQMPFELKLLLSLTVKEQPVFGRVQLNFKIGREPKPDVQVMEKAILRFPYQRFILSWNEANAELISEVYHREKVVFDCLADSSFGEGIAVQQFEGPPFPDVFQGYAGGLSADNIVEKLKLLQQVVPADRAIFVDAEGKLKGDDGKFSVEKARAFLCAIVH
jgi:hypothetical protein